MNSRGRSRAIVSTTTLAMLVLLLIQLGTPAASLASQAAPATPTVSAAAGKPGNELLLMNYDIRVNGGASLAGLLDQLVPGGAEQIAKAARVKIGAMQAGLAQLQAALPAAEASFSPLLGTPELVRIPPGALTTPAPGQPGIAIVRDFLHEYKALYGLSDAQIDALHALGESQSRASGLRMIRLEQVVDGLPVFQSDTRFILDRQGRLIRSVGQLVPDSALKPQVTPIAAPVALQAALAGVGIALPADAITLVRANPAGTSAEVATSDARISMPVASELVYFPAAPGLLITAWAQVIFTNGDADWYTLVDAHTGTLLWRKNIRANDNPIAPQQPPARPDRGPAEPALAPTSTQAARFSVYVQGDGVTPADSPAPQSPSSAVPGAGTQYPEIARTTVTMQAAQDLAASPAGWIPDGGTTTTGNNVDAYLDRVSGAGETNLPDIGALDSNGRPVGNPDGSANNRDFLGSTPRDFTTTFTPPPQAGNPEAGQTATGTGVAFDTFRRGAVTQLFYIANWYHDQLYKLGFDEAAGNFQQTNFSGSGVGGDLVLAEAQDAAGTNNANFSTPPDGSAGRMQMYRFTGPTIDRDGGLDAEIVIHELTHGLSNRLIGNGSGLMWSIGMGMGEGWSDFYALSLLNNTNADNPDGNYATGAYVTYKLAGLTDNYVYGIRRFPYSTNNSVNPLTWADADDVTANYAGGIAISPLGFQNNGAFEVHNIGELWALSLWEVRSRIIADPAGANGDVPTGNHTMLQIVTDALKMTPLNPSFIEARDALIDADCAANACANERWIWAGFADRGLGYQAVAPLKQIGFSNYGHMGVGESFALPRLDVASVAVNDSHANNNGTIDPGEPIALTVTLANPWHSASKNIGSASATLSSATPGVSIIDNSATYGAIPAQGSAAGDSFLFTLSPAAACGQSLKFTLQTTSALGTTSTDFTLRVGAASGTGTPVIYTKTNSPGLAIPDIRPHGISDSLTIPDDLEIADLNFRVDNLQHTFTGDLTVMLKAPNGYGTDLIWLRAGLLGGGDGDNFINTVIDGQSTNDLNQSTTGMAPYTGSWAPAFNSPVWALFGNPAIFPDPADQLGRLNGQSTQGTWAVQVADQFAIDTGTLNSWSLIVTPRAFSCAAFTPTVAITGTKSVTGALVAGGAITYTIELTNNGTASQADNPGNELVDVLPAQLTLVSASASSGTAVANLGTNAVSWNGALGPLGGAATITIHATIKPDTSGAAVVNQASVAFDADANGTNEANVPTDDPGTPAANDATSFVVGAPQIVATNVAALVVDVSGNGLIDPGDTLEYTVVISNTGGDAAENVSFASQALDPSVQLVVGSATTTLGTVGSGNTPGNTTVQAAIGALPAGGHATVKYRVKLALPLLTRASSVSSHGIVAGDNFVSVLTDNPATAAAQDATITPIVRPALMFIAVIRRD